MDTQDTWRSLGQLMVESKQTFAVEGTGRITTFDAILKQKKLKEQWVRSKRQGREHLRVKKCGCGRDYTPEEWKSLPLAITPNAPDGTYKDAYCTQEMRHCLCNSTITIMTEIHDLFAE